MKKIILAIAAIIITVGAYAQVDQKRTPGSDTATYNKMNKKKLPDGYVMRSGKVMCVKNQKMTVLKHDTTLSNGTVIMSNGDYVKKGETKKMFKEGQHMDLSGKLTFLGTDDQAKRMNGNKKMYVVTDTTKNKE